MPTIQDTFDFIKRVHGGQVDKSGHPFWWHPLSVMFRLGPNATETERHAALLHDVIEDTPTTAQDLRNLGYPQEVVDAVQLVSRPSGPDRPTYDSWIRSIAESKNVVAIRVKIADSEDNADPERVACLPPEDRDIAERYRASLPILQQALRELSA